MEPVAVDGLDKHNAHSDDVLVALSLGRQAQFVASVRAVC